MSFKENKYEVIRSVISKDLAEFLDLEFELIKNVAFAREGVDPETNPCAFGDDQVSKSFAYYSPFCFEALSCALNNVMNEATGKILYPTYTYARIYYKNAEMKIHKDRPSCQYSATINLSNEPEPWDIWFKTEEGKDIAIALHPGDMIVYKGTDLEHWRDPNPNDRVSQAFLHYVDANGEYADYRYDKRPYLGFPSNTRMV